jgi:hypothetical protein
MGRARLFRAGKADFGHGHAKLLRDQPDGFGEGDVLNFLHETEDIARDAATEAVVELARSVDGERRRLLVVEGTESGEVLRARLLQLDVVAHNADDVGLLLEGFFEIVRTHWRRILFHTHCEAWER